MLVILYLLTIIIANLVTVIFPPTHLGFIVIPPSAYFMGFTFILSNLLQDKYGASKSRGLVWTGVLLSALLFAVLQFSQSIVIASGVAFLVSQFVNTFLYDKLKHTRIKDYALLTSSVISSLLDVSIFVIIGLSPLGLGVLHGIDVVLAIVGQFAVQTILQVIAKKLLNSFYYSKIS